MNPDPSTHPPTPSQIITRPTVKIALACRSGASVESFRAEEIDAVKTDEGVREIYPRMVAFERICYEAKIQFPLTELMTGESCLLENAEHDGWGSQGLVGKPHSSTAPISSSSSWEFYQKTAGIQNIINIETNAASEAPASSPSPPPPLPTTTSTSPSLPPPRAPTIITSNNNRGRGGNGTGGSLGGTSGSKATSQSLVASAKAGSATGYARSMSLARQSEVLNTPLYRAPTVINHSSRHQMSRRDEKDNDNNHNSNNHNSNNQIEISYDDDDSNHYNTNLDHDINMSSSMIPPPTPPPIPPPPPPKH